MKPVIASAAKQSSFVILFWIASSLALLAMTGCAPQQQVYSPLAADETHLPLKSWLPKGKPKAIIIAVHGFNDYSNAFQTTGAFFKAHGIAVVAYDQRGFGRASYIGIWGNEKNLTSDLAECVKQTSRRWLQAPIYILGESMGGAVAIAALADPTFPKVQGVILSAPALWGAETMNPLYHGSLWLAAHTWPSYRLSGRELHIMASDNILMLEALGRDKLVIKQTRIDAIYGLVGLMDDAYEHISDVKTPVLLLYGAHDEVIPREPIEAARARFTVPITFVYYPDGYHMLLRDIEGELVMRDILSWMQCQISKNKCHN